MNFTDVDDKTIKRSQEMHPDQSPLMALQTLLVTMSKKIPSRYERYREFHRRYRVCSCY